MELRIGTRKYSIACRPDSGTDQKPAVYHEETSESKTLFRIILMICLTICNFSIVTAQTLHLAVLALQFDAADGFPKTVQFFCTQDYELESCKKDARVLRKLLATYPVERVGSWSFLLAPSIHWNDLMRALGLQSHVRSPAFTVLGFRTTVFEQSLFSGPLSARGELRRTFQISEDSLLQQLAVSHELAHILCNDTDEYRADTNSRHLRAGELLACRDIRPNIVDTVTPRR
jgi:hypothetical protein